ncbi:vWA domain-containing protein [Streptomyces sp. NPDC007205]|uniref:vWA domain-containing protein n=1 Tax=Streptomyces sp. NPDC007205 TaxID=3154316 RepID=UPI0033ED892B
MTGRPGDPADTKAVVVPAGGVLAGARVGVSAADWPPASASQDIRLRVLTVDTGYDSTSVAVEVVPLDDVPSGVLAIPDDLAQTTDFAGAEETATWRLDAAPVVEARSVRLESSTERSLDDTARDLAEAGLVGRVMWIPHDKHELWLDVDSVPFRVQQYDIEGRDGVILRIGERTAVDLFVPGARSGVDIVILADCSGSMGCDDIASVGEYAAARRSVVRDWRTYVGSRSRTAQVGMSRMRALQDALQHLLDVRLQVSGRVSRVALVEFTHGTRQVFPRQGGMSEVDAGTPQEAEAFRHAIALLQAQNAGTDIGNALHEAANLLYRHHKPGNEKLIVLVSDGAHWAPKGEQGSGEVVYAHQEPVSLMEHLHGATGIRVHAIGISTPAMYERWLAQTGGQDHESLRPDHALLAELVRVGGGDPAAIGGYEVLDEYFSGLGAGLSRRVRVTRGQSTASGLPAATTQVLRDWAVRLSAGRTVAQSQDLARRRESVRERLSAAVGRCVEAAQTALRTPLLDQRQLWDAVTRGMEGRRGVPDAKAFVRMVTRALLPQSGQAPLPERVAACHQQVREFLSGLTEEHNRLTASGTGVDDDAWIVERCDRLADLVEALALQLEALPPAANPPANPPAGPPEDTRPADQSAAHEARYEVESALGTASMTPGSSQPTFPLGLQARFRL